MKKTIQNLFCFILCVIIMSLCIISVLASDAEKHSTGLIPYMWEDIINNEYTFSDVTINRKGDINQDGCVSGVDALICLRAVAGFKQNFDFMQESALDINGKDGVTAVDARIILQMVVGTKTVDTVVETITGDGFVIGPLQYSEGTAYYWQCEVDKDGLTILERDFDDSPPNAIGGLVRKYFVITPEAKGTYTINFKLANVNQTEIIDEFNCILTVN